MPGDPTPPKAAKAPQTVCSAGQMRCTPQGRESCNDARTAWAPATACPAQEMCLAGGCLSLSPQATWRPLAPGGWIRAWSQTQTAPDRLRVSKDALLREPGKQAWMPACSDAPALTLIEGQKKNRRRAVQTFVATTLVSGTTQEVYLKAGSHGELTLWLDGKEVMAHTQESWYEPWIDQWIAKVTLPAGQHQLVAHLRQPDRWDTRFHLRIHDMAHQVPPNIVTATPWTEATCTDAALLRVDWTAQPVEGGFRLKADLAPSATLTQSHGPLPYTLSLVQADQRRTVLREGKLSLQNGAWTPDAEPQVIVKLPRPGTYTIEAKVGQASKASSLLYHGQDHERVVALRKAWDALSTRDNLPQGTQDSYNHHLETMEALLRDGDADQQWLKLLLQEAEGLSSELAAGRDAYQWRQGLVRRAYRSELDDKLQPYMVHVPEGYGSDSGPLPVVMVAHGLGNEPAEAMRALVGQARSGGMSRTDARRKMPRIPESGAILVAPMGYGSNGQRLMGEWDVVRVLEEVKAHYKVNEAKVSITGYSLGGTVAFVVPLHYPDLFSAAAPLCGYPNLMDYREVKRVRNRKPWEETLLHKRYLRNVAENGRHLPMHVVHGGKDFPERSEIITERYQSLRYQLIYDLQPDMGHNVWDHAYDQNQMVRWLMRPTRPKVPKRVALKVPEYRYNKAWWVEVLSLSNPDEIGSVDAVWQDNKRQINIKTEYIRVLSIKAGDLLQGGEGVLRIDGQTLPLPAGQPQVWAVAKGGSWTMQTRAPDLSGQKNPTLSGPLDHARLKPSLIIYGTQDPAQTETNRLVAQHHAGVNDRTSADFPIKADDEVTQEELARHTLVLIGNPDSNLITRRVAEDLPVRFTDAGIEAGAKVYDAPDAGVSLIYPSPLAKDQYVVLHAGRGVEGTLASRHLPEMSPDFVIYDNRIKRLRGQTLLDKREILAGGFFTPDWRLP